MAYNSSQSKGIAEPFTLKTIFSDNAVYICIRTVFLEYFIGKYIIQCMCNGLSIEHMSPAFVSFLLLVFIVALDSLHCSATTTDDRVCGTDGVTYDSRCQLLRRKLGATQIRHSSRCDDPECTPSTVSAVTLCACICI